MPLSPELEAWLVENLDSKEVPLGEGYQARVSRISTPQGDLAVKRPRRGTLLMPLARAAIRREYAAYQRLSRVDGIPRAHGLIGEDWLVLDFVPGSFLRAEQDRIGDPERFYTRLLTTIQAMHAAGVAHGDLKRKDNVIVSADEQPYLIDFGIARVRGRSGLDNLLFGFTQQLDLNAWIKLKHGRMPVSLPPADALLYRPLLIERIARWIRIPWQKLTLRRPRQRLRRWLAARKNHKP